MVQTKKMNQASFSKLLRQFNVAGELVRARQDEKQSILDEFTNESKRFVFGKISERTLAASAKKTNKELMRLDQAIRVSITDAKRAADKAKELTTAQAPIGYRATLSGISGGKAKKSAKKKPAKKKAVKKAAKKKPVKKAAKKKPAKKAKKVAKKKK
ncbi:hypothetical protein KAR91_57785 [Candidatus Pacearchaeota archaeon]|nr:hypothetical protein [Candidatus Pacearchaeota archaeon]